MELNAERSAITPVDPPPPPPPANIRSRPSASLEFTQEQSTSGSCADQGKKEKNPRVPEGDAKILFSSVTFLELQGRKGLFFPFLSKCFQPFWPAENTFLSAYESPGSPHETTRRIFRILSVCLPRPFQFGGKQKKNLKGERKGLTSVTVRQIQADQIRGSRFGCLNGCPDLWELCDLHCFTNFFAKASQELGKKRLTLSTNEPGVLFFFST